MSIDLLFYFFDLPGRRSFNFDLVYLAKQRSLHLTEKLMNQFQISQQYWRGTHAASLRPMLARIILPQQPQRPDQQTSGPRLAALLWPQPMLVLIGSFPPPLMLLDCASMHHSRCPLILPSQWTNPTLAVCRRLPIGELFDKVTHDIRDHIAVKYAIRGNSHFATIKRLYLPTL